MIHPRQLAIPAGGAGRGRHAERLAASCGAHQRAPAPPWHPPRMSARRRTAVTVVCGPLVPWPPRAGSPARATCVGRVARASPREPAGHVPAVRAVQTGRLVAVSTFTDFAILNRAARAVLVTPTAGWRGAPLPRVPGPVREGEWVRTSRRTSPRAVPILPAPRAAARASRPAQPPRRKCRSDSPMGYRRARAPHGASCPVSYGPLFGGPLCSSKACRQRRLAMGEPAGWSPAPSPSPRGRGRRGGCPVFDPGLVPVGDAGWALWTVGRWLYLPPSIWG